MESAQSDAVNQNSMQSSKDCIEELNPENGLNKEIVDPAAGPASTGRESQLSKKSRLTKTIIIASAVAAVTIMVVVVVLLTTHIVCFHEWSEVTCTEPQTCSICGGTQGEASGHKWIDATVDKPKICSVCQETEGDSIKKTYERGVKSFSDGELIKAKKYFVDISSYEDTTSYLTLIERTAAFNGVYVEKVASSETPHEWLVLENGHAGTYTNYTKGGYTEGFGSEYVPSGMDGLLTLVYKYEYQGTSTQNTRYILTEEDGVKTVRSSGGISKATTYVFTNMKKEQFETNLKKTPAKKAPFIGMTADEARSSTWGSPSKVNTTKTANGTHEQWVYSTGRYIYLDNGFVTTIQE